MKNILGGIVEAVLTALEIIQTVRELDRYDELPLPKAMKRMRSSDEVLNRVKAEREEQLNKKFGGQ